METSTRYHVLARVLVIDVQELSRIERFYKEKIKSGLWKDIDVEQFR